MPSVIIFNNTSNPAQVKEFITSVDPTPYNGRQDVKIYDDTTTPTESTVKEFVSGKLLRYLKISGNNVVDMTASEINQVDVDIATALLNRQRSEAKEAIDSSDHSAKLLRAIIIVLLDEINSLRSWIRSFKTETAAATNLANFQTRVATLPNMPDRTTVQARTAIKASIDAGTADS